MQVRRRVLVLGWSLFLLSRQVNAADLGPQELARQVDALLAEESFGGAEADAARPMAKADDQTFLRRLALDLIGYPPTPEEITAYALDPSADKRAAAVERLLASKQFGENWARYWRDVIMYRRTEDRALLVNSALVQYLADEFNGESRWDKIARRFIAATGDVREEGATAIIMAQMGNAEDTTAEVSRIFLGIQIQCAQCHDHPTDRWKREQFHELAAFFPRISVRPVKATDSKKRLSFEVVSVDKGPKKAKNPNPRRGSLEHYMPDLQHPEEQGTLMEPVFFVTGQKLDSGQDDVDRRTTVADWITHRDNEWFARAYVNRMWAELVGRGFYEPVDDIGPDRDCSAPRTLDFLAAKFVASNYDVKALFRVITATEAYARQSRSRYEEGKAPFTASCPQRLRGDQLFNALMAVLGIEDDAAKGRGQDNYRNVDRGPRGLLNREFGYDPSIRRDEVAGSIPQALFLMNGPQLNLALNGKSPRTSLGKLLGEIDQDDALVTELYLRCLAREPKEAELQTCLDYARTVGNRAEAFEDVLWSLINSTEFLNRK